MQLPAPAKRALRKYIAAPLLKGTLRALDVDADFLRTVFGGEESWTGERVTELSAMQTSAVYGCMRVLSESISTIPCLLYRAREDGSRERMKGHHLYTAFHDAPNPEMTALQAFETMVYHLGLRGNAYWEIQSNRHGEPYNFWPIVPNRVRPYRSSDDGQIYYEVTLPTAKPAVIDRAHMLHIRGLSPNGLTGFDPLTLMRQVIGHNIGISKSAAKFFDNALVPFGAYKHPKKLGDKAYKRLVKSLEGRHKGIDKHHRLLLLEEGLEFASMTVTPENAQMLQSRNFGIREICRVFRVPPHLVAEMENATFSNIEHQGLEFILYSLRGWTRRIEQEINKHFFLGTGLYVEFLLEDMLRADAKTQAEALEIELRNGALNLDEWRHIKNRPTLPDDLGQVHIIPLNYQNLANLAAEPDAPEEGDTDADPGIEDEGEEKESGAPGSSPAGNRLHAGTRGAALRRILAASWRHTFAQATTRYLRRERQDVIAAAKRLGSDEGSDEFVAWLYEYYGRDGVFPVYLSRQVTPPIRTFCEAICAEAAADVDLTTDQFERFEEFLAEYIKGFVRRYALASRHRLRNVAFQVRDEAQESGTLREELIDTFDRWDRTRPQIVAGWETVRGANAIAYGFAQAAGIKKVRWRMFGKPNPFCQQFDGRVVDIGTPFVSAGNLLGSGGATLSVATARLHPPLYRGCECQIEYVQE